MKDHPDYPAVKAMISATFERLNKYGEIAEVWWVKEELRTACDKKVREAFQAIFGDMGLEKLSVAKAVLDELAPPLVVTHVDHELRTITFKTKETVAGPTSSTTLSPPASVQLPKPAPKRKKGK